MSYRIYHCLFSTLQIHWVLCVQESVLDSVVARLRLRMSGKKCVRLTSDADRILVDAAVQKAQQQGAMVSQRHLYFKFYLKSCNSIHRQPIFYHRGRIWSQRMPFSIIPSAESHLVPVKQILMNSDLVT